MHENSLKNLRPWHQGQTGNPNGRPTARSRLTERFIADVSLTWEQHGSAVLQKMATKEPTRFADMCSKLIPRDVTLSLEARHIGGLSSQDMEIFRAIKEALPDANQRPAGEVLEYTLAALRAYDAKTIDYTENPSELSSKKPA
jgi:hypothetical protein